MPILPPEPDRFPTDLFSSPDAPGHSWSVLHTKPRQEKSLARQLLLARVPFFLPCVSRRRRHGGRLLLSRVPLFTSYVFLLADRPQRLAALCTNRVVHALDVADQSAFRRDLSQIDRLLALKLPITPEERLEPGDPVEITAGPLAGLNGIVVRAASGRRFVVRVDFIQKGASILLEASDLVPLERDGQLA